MKQKAVKYRRVSRKAMEARSRAVVADLDSGKTPEGAEVREVRTNIVMDEPLVKQAQAITGIKTKTGVVHHALKEIVRRAKMKELLELRGKVAWDGDLDEMRRSR